MKIKITLNGELREIRVHPMKRMLDVLREDFGLLGAKEGCGEGECGACAVVMDGLPVDTCLIPAVQMAGREIVTIEGLGAASGLDLLQQAFLDEGAIHCGFCTPAMIMAGYALLSRNPHPTREDAAVALSGNICRCTGYEKIIKAVMRTASLGYGEKAARFPSLADGTAPIFESDEIGRYFAPASLAEALDILRRHEDVLVFAGGTDIVPDIKARRVSPGRVMDVFGVPELNGIEQAADGNTPFIRIGACATNTDIMRSEITRKRLPALVSASSRSGAATIQNRATIGGNIMTASGAGDLPVALLALGARAVASGPRGDREMSLDDFIAGYRKTALQKGELLKEIRVPVPPTGTRQAFYKRGSRKALTLARVSLAFCVRCEGGRVAEFRAAAGSMSPIPLRLKLLSEAMPGRELTPALADEAARLAYADVNPRKTPLYRKTIVANLTHRFFTGLLREEEMIE